MRTRHAQTFIDRDGQPFDGRIQLALRHVRAPLLSRFPALGDDTVMTEILEETGRRLLAHEQTAGPVRSLPAFLWITAQNAARSRLRRSTLRAASVTLDAKEQDVAFASLEATLGSAAEIEARILLRELLERLTPDERRLVTLKNEGLSGREIAQRLRMSVGQVNVAFFRLKGKLARTLGKPTGTPGRPIAAQRTAKASITRGMAGQLAPLHPLAEAADRPARRRTGPDKPNRERG